VDRVEDLGFVGSNAAVNNCNGLDIAGNCNRSRFFYADEHEIGRTTGAKDNNKNKEIDQIFHNVGFRLTKNDLRIAFIAARAVKEVLAGETI